LTPALKLLLQDGKETVTYIGTTVVQRGNSYQTLIIGLILGRNGPLVTTGIGG